MADIAADLKQRFNWAIDLSLEASSSVIAQVESVRPEHAVDGVQAWRVIAVAATAIRTVRICAYISASQIRWVKWPNNIACRAHDVRPDHA